MTRKFLRDLSDGDSVDEVFLLADKQLRANRNADLYLLATLRDKTGLISGLMWNVSEQAMQHLNAGEFVRVKGKVQMYQGGLQMIVTYIDAVPETAIDPEDFHPEKNPKIEPMLNRVREILLNVDDAKIRLLMEAFLTDEPLMEAFSEAPAGIKAHHAWHGGLMEHVLNMLEVALAIDPFYPQLNTSLLLAGVFLHDLGKTRELSWDPAFAYTDEGQLLGHMPIAVEMLTQKIAEVVERTGESFPEETELHLKHLILSHHGSYEFGSSRLPMTPEAIALTHIDNLDAKVNEFAKMIQDDPDGDSNWTPFNPRLNRKLYKIGRKK